MGNKYEALGECFVYDKYSNILYVAGSKLVSYYDMNINKWYNLPKPVYSNHYLAILWKECNILYLASTSYHTMEYLDLRQQKKKWNVIPVVFNALLEYDKSVKHTIKI